MGKDCLDYCGVVTGLPQTHKLKHLPLQRKGGWDLDENGEGRKTVLKGLEGFLGSISP